MLVEFNFRETSERHEVQNEMIVVSQSFMVDVSCTASFLNGCKNSEYIDQLILALIFRFGGILVQKVGRKRAGVAVFKKKTRSRALSGVKTLGFA